jgi:hypothetical protein
MCISKLDCLLIIQLLLFASKKRRKIQNPSIKVDHKNKFPSLLKHPCLMINKIRAEGKQEYRNS